MNEPEMTPLYVLRAAVGSAGRKVVARKMGMRYSTLGSKLNGFSEFSGDELATIWKVLKELESKKKDEPELASAPGRMGG